MTRNVLMGALAVVLSVATGASAATISAHGSLFVAYNAGQAQNVDYTTGGARTNLAGGQFLIAPVIRNTIAAGNQTFTLHGWHSGVQTSNCNAHSSQADGTIIVTKGLSAVNVAGIWGRSATMTAAELPNQGKVDIICGIPGSFNGLLSGITATP